MRRRDFLKKSAAVAGVTLVDVRAFAQEVLALADQRGFGRGATGSTAPVTTVTSLSALRSALSGGKNVKVNVPAGTVWNLAGTNLNVKSNTTCDFGNLVLRGGAAPFIKGPASNIVLRNLRSHAGDESGNAQDLDAGTINGNNGPVRNLYLANCQWLWGPDVVTAVLGDVADVTFDQCLFAEGLYHSKHPEAPHSLGPNVASTTATKPASRISFIECLVTTCQSRNFRLIGVAQAEVIGSTIYNHAEGPQGCPASANLLGCTWKKGPAAAAAGEKFVTLLFRAQDGGHGAFVAKANTVYVGKSQVIGYTSSGVDPKVKATTLRFTSTVPEPDPVAAHATVLASVGAQPADKQLTRIVANVKNGQGLYVNGTSSGKQPTPSWP